MFWSCSHKQVILLRESVTGELLWIARKKSIVFCENVVSVWWLSWAWRDSWWHQKRRPPCLQGGGSGGVWVQRGLQWHRWKHHMSTEWQVDRETWLQRWAGWTKKWMTDEYSAFVFETLAQEPQFQWVCSPSEKIFPSPEMKSHLGTTQKQLQFVVSPQPLREIDWWSSTMWRKLSLFVWIRCFLLLNWTLWKLTWVRFQSPNRIIFSAEIPFIMKFSCRWQETRWREKHSLQCRYVLHILWSSFWESPVPTTFVSTKYTSGIQWFCWFIVCHPILVGYACSQLSFIYVFSSISSYSNTPVAVWYWEVQPCFFCQSFRFANFKISTLFTNQPTLYWLPCVWISPCTNPCVPLHTTKKMFTKTWFSYLALCFPHFTFCEKVSCWCFHTIPGSVCFRVYPSSGWVRHCCGWLRHCCSWKCGGLLTRKVCWALWR